MKTFCAVETCWHHSVNSDEVGYVDFPCTAAELSAWTSLTWVRHVVRGVTRVCTSHFLAEDLVLDPQWEAMYPGQANPNPTVKPGARPFINVPGWLDETQVKDDSSVQEEAPSMFVRHEAARRVRPTERLRDAHETLFSGSAPVVVRRRGRGPGRPPKRPVGRPRISRIRPPERTPDLSDPEVRARLVQQALDDYEWRQQKAMEKGRVVAADGTETLYVSLPDEDELGSDGAGGAGSARVRRSRGGRRGRGGRGGGHVQRRYGVDGTIVDVEEEPPATRLPPNTSQRFREILAKQRELQALTKQLSEAPPLDLSGAGLAEHSDFCDGEALMVLRDWDASLSADAISADTDHYSTPSSLELSLEQLHQQRLQNLQLRAELVRCKLRERRRVTELAEARRQAEDATKLFGDRLGGIVTPTQVKTVSERWQRVPVLTTEEVKRAIGLRRLCTRRAYTYVKSVLKVPLPGLAELRGWSERHPETARLYQEMVAAHLHRHRSKQVVLEEGRCGSMLALEEPPKAGVRLLQGPNSGRSDEEMEVTQHTNYLVFPADQPGQQTKPQTYTLQQQNGLLVAAPTTVEPGSVEHAALLAQPGTVILQETPAEDPALVISAPDSDQPSARYLVVMENGEVEMQERLPEPASPPSQSLLSGEQGVRSLVSRHPVSQAAGPRFKVMVKGEDGTVLVPQELDADGVEWLVPPGQWVAGTQVDFTDGQT